jgi:hypothetical protein
MIDYMRILVLNFPNTEWEIINNDYSTLVWKTDSVPKPSKEELEALWGKTREEVSFQNLRLKRNNFLLKSDWTQVADAPVDQAVWAEYRQALRDLPENTIDFENPVWPTPPE